MIKCNQNGRTMLEVLSVLMIIGMIASAILMTINKVYDKQKLSRIGHQITELQKNINSRYAADGDYSGLKVSDLIEEKLIPSDMTSSNRVYHAYGGNVSISTADAGGYLGENKAFTVSFAQLPIHVCIELASMNWQYSNTSDLIAVTINEKTYYWPDGDAAKTTSETLPVSIGAAGTYCNSKNNSIEWTFY